MKGELGGAIMAKCITLRTKTYSYFIDNDSGGKKANDTKLRFENYIYCLQATQLESKINYIEEKKFDIENHKEFIKNNNIILKTQQRFKSGKHNVFTEESNKTALSSHVIEECNQLILYKHMHKERAKIY